MILRLLFVAFILAGCASYQAEIADPYRKILNREPLVAAEMLKPKAFQEGNDQLVYLLEYATALHEAGQYEESTKAFLKAYDMVEIKDYHSLSKITGSLLLNEGMIQYKGEDFEKVMVNVYLAINYLMMNKLEDAAVEVRRINEILEKFRMEAKRPYDQNPFARYLSAVIWEENRNWDSMYIDYKNTYDLNPSFRLLQEDLLWAAKRARRDDDLSKWKSQFKDAKVDELKDSKEAGELIVIFQAGQGPIKQPNPAWYRIPKLYPRSYRVSQGKVSVTNAMPENSNLIPKPIEFTTDKVFSLEDTAIKNLDDQYSEIIAKRAAGVVTKAVVSDQIRQKNKLLGDLTWIAMNVADQADLRQWATLPASLHIARKMLKPGKYKVRVTAIDGAGIPTEEAMPEKEITITPKKKTFITWRAFR